MSEIRSRGRNKPKSQQSSRAVPKRDLENRKKSRHHRRGGGALTRTNIFVAEREREPRRGDA